MRTAACHARWVTSGFLLAACLCGAGCEDEKRAALYDAGASDAGSGPVLGGKLGAALAAAEASSSPSSGAAGKTGDGPPEGGVFKAGEADRAAARGSRPKLQLLADGADPKTTLALALEPGATQVASITVGMRQGPQRQLPTLTFKIAFEIDKGKDDKGKSAPARVVGKVKSVTPDPAQKASMPKELLDALDKLKGSEVRFTLGPDGGASDFSQSLAKGADPQLDLMLRSVVDALSLLVLPLPAKPVGQGAYWMITDRAASSGMDVVRYRVVHVQSIDKSGASLTLETREYAADDRFDMPVADGPKVSLEQLDMQGKGTADVAPTGFLPIKGELEKRMQARLKGPQQGRPMMLQVDTTAKLAPAAAAK